MLRSEVDSFLVAQMTMSGFSPPWNISSPSRTAFLDMGPQIIPQWEGEAASCGFIQGQTELGGDSMTLEETKSPG